MVVAHTLKNHIDGPGSTLATLLEWKGSLTRSIRPAKLSPAVRERRAEPAAAGVILASEVNQASPGRFSTGANRRKTVKAEKTVSITEDLVRNSGLLRNGNAPHQACRKMLL